MTSGRPPRRSAPATRAVRAYVDGRIDALRTELIGFLGREPSAQAPRTISSGDAARILGVGKPHVARLAAAEGLGAKVGSRWRLDREKVLALKARREP